MKCVSFLMLVFAATQANARPALRPSISASCSAVGAGYREFRFDLYPTGHPMGGIGMYTGMFMALRDGYELYGYMEAQIPRNKHYVFRGSAAPLQERFEFEIEIETETMEADVPHKSTLRHRVSSPIYESEPMECRFH